MNISEIIQKVRSGIVSFSFYDKDDKISSGSGFIVGGKIISCYHIFLTPKSENLPLESMVKIKFGDNVGEYTFQYDDFMKKIEGASSHNDYVVVDIGESTIKNKYHFEFESYDDILEGDEVLIMGFPFGFNRLSSHVGYISSKYQDKIGTEVLQIDTSVNRGNSGSPLIDLQTLKVVGIITNKETGLTKELTELKESLKPDIQCCKDINDDKNKHFKLWKQLKLTDIIIMFLEQMETIIENIEKSANVGIGYAFSCNEIMKEFLQKVK